MNPVTTPEKTQTIGTQNALARPAKIRSIRLAGLHPAQHYSQWRVAEVDRSGRPARHYLQSFDL